MELVIFIVVILFVLSYFYWLFSHNQYLLLLRQILLCLPGFYAHGIILFFDGRGFFTVHMTIAQVPEITRQLFAMTLIALLASHGGFKLARRVQLGVTPKGRANYNQSGLFASNLQARVALYLGYLVVLTVSGFISFTTSPVWELPYGHNFAEKTLLGNLNVIVSIGLSLILVSILFLAKSGQKVQKHYLLFFVIVGYSLLWAFWFRGRRMDVFNALISLGFTSLVFRRTQFISRRGKLLLVSTVISLFLVGLIWGRIRSTDDISLSAVREISPAVFFDSARDVPLQLSTIGDVCATFAGTVFFVQNFGMEIQWGKGYLNYLPRSIPGFLWSDRPDDEAWIFSRVLGETSGGGFFELAEAYYNFGWVGIFITPFVLSFIISWFYHASLFRPRLFQFLLLIGLLGAWWRGAWYQNFAFWRGATTSLVIWIVLHFAFLIGGGFLRSPRLKQSNPNQRSHTMPPKW